jgi:hypothetical protein
MKSSRFSAIIALIALSLLPLLTFSQDAKIISEEVTKALRQGNAAEMAKFFGRNVDLTLPGSEGTFSRSQSEVILRNFFSRNTPTSFTVNHDGSSRDGSVYVIGTYKTRGGQSYRVYFYVKKVSESFFLHQVQFELQ